MPAEKQSKWIPGRYPPPGTSPIGDAIRKRRGERGITALDAALLHAPPIAEGWNTLLGAVRTNGSIGGDVRELMILRVAAINGAAYEWIHHEPVGRQHGLTTAQLYIIRDIGAPLPPAQGILNPLQTTALTFADAISGFEAGARALGSYDVLSLGVLESSISNVLLLAGSLDGGGKVGASLKQFGQEWNEKRKAQGRREAEFVLVEGSGHLPMVDQPEEFWKAVEAFLTTV
ncbi:hypothetical protein AN958_02034 [Leucoagaricus sp. SymC.cos]|nr:hypothetical protein AN958_02034 [Leucoagaricus sp. SymC.cos]